MIKTGRQAALVTLCALALMVGSVGLQAASEPREVDAADARILIDISGSMKKNDPQNLRRPALRMLVGLLPDDARAGVWTFGQYVNMLIPLGQVDQSWQDKARQLATKIGSPGQFTNVEDVLKRAMADWDGASTIYRRHMILLTDGMVDISKDPKKNAASRKRILEQLLPKLKQHQAKVHTIALSERADHELMKALAEETGGWNEQATDAQQLQRIFLRIFEKVGKPDTVPLRDNKFTVDGSIQEVTLLIFRKEGADPTQVVTPGGQQFGAKDAPESVSWHRDIGYDMLTIDKPEVGQWRVLAATDPDNRVIVVTDLKMKSTELPPRFVLGEQLPLEVSFTNQGKTITRKEFLDVVNLQSEHVDSQGAGEPRPLFDNGEGDDPEAGDGVFSLNIGDGLAAGRVELVVRAQGKTFEREKRQVFELAEAVKLEVLPTPQGEPAELKVQLTPDPELVDQASLQYQATLVSLQGEEQAVALQPVEDSLTQQVDVDPSTLVGDWQLGLNVTGKTKAGSALNMQFDPIAIKGTAEPPPPPAPEPVAEPEPEPEPAKLELATPEPKEPERVDWVMTAAVFGGGNVAAIILGFGIYAYVRRRNRNNELKLLEDEEGGEEPATETARAKAKGEAADD